MNELINLSEINGYIKKIKEESISNVFFSDDDVPLSGISFRSDDGTVGTYTADTDGNIIELSLSKDNPLVCYYWFTPEARDLGDIFIKESIADTEFNGYTTVGINDKNEILRLISPSIPLIPTVNESNTNKRTLKP